jgi:hypothetical protein
MAITKNKSLVFEASQQWEAFFLIDVTVQMYYTHTISMTG